MSTRPHPLRPAARLVLPLTLATVAGAQAPRAKTAASPETGAFVTTLGRDTVAAEQFVRAGNRVEGDIVNRMPQVRLVHYVVTLDAAGRPLTAVTETRLADGTPVPNAPLGVTGTFRGDSVAYEIRWADSTARRAAPAPAGTLPLVNNSYGLYEIGTRRLRAAGVAADSLRLVGAGAPRPTALAIAFAGDSARLDYFGDPVLLRLDRAGHILAVDGTRSTNKVTVTRVSSVDVRALARAMAARPAMGQASPRDTARATVGGAQLLVDYGRPSKRGRTVWGGTLVPFGQVWRTGANAATQLVTSADLVIGTTQVPAGTYTLFTMPTAQGYQLIVNREKGQWGTEYHEAQDLARIPLTASTLATPVEQFTIAIEPGANGAGTLALRWDDKQLTVPVRAAR